MELLLKKYFGYDKFRPSQLEIIESVLSKKDTLVLMPTGGGKSLCYQIPALKFEGLTIVISPLISLMKDQVDALRANGISAEYINSTLTPKSIGEIVERIRDGEVKILYVAPERFSSTGFKEFLSTINISLIAIDEAHCISEWGHDFRKDYGNLKFLKKNFPDVPIIALTATATLKVKEDILNQLKLDEPNIFISGFDRENLNLIVMRKENAFEKMLSLLEKYKGESTIIYCYSRKDTENLVKQLKKEGHKALVYHAGLNNTTRQKNQELFINDKFDIMVATIAFGMGIDKPDVRLVIHHTFSKSVEGYYQEIGRAGRDGLPSECVLFYTKSDLRKQEFFVNMIKDPILKKGSFEKLDEMVSYCESESCRRKYILEYFGDDCVKSNCNSCDICLELPEMQGIATSTSKKKTSYDSSLFNELRTLRKEIAEEKGVPPFIIFSDVALRDMATKFPKTDAEFMNINGVGEQKLRDYGEDFLMAINDYLMVNEVANSITGDTGMISSTDMFDTEEGVEYKNYASDILIESIIDGEESVPFKKRRTTKKKTKKKKKTRAVANNDLYLKLKSLRKGIAGKKGVAAYVVFADTALKEMARKLPKNSVEFMDIKGVGPKKLTDYGREFLNVINSYRK